MTALRTMSWDEPKRITDAVKFELPSYSRDAVTIVSGAGVLEIGSVLGRITASGKFKLCSPAAVDGSQVAVAVLMTKVDASAADKQALVLARIAEVSNTGLVWHVDLNTAPERATATAELKAVGIIVRQGA